MNQEKESKLPPNLEGLGVKAASWIIFFVVKITLPPSNTLAIYPCGKKYQSDDTPHDSKNTKRAFTFHILGLLRRNITKV